MPAPFEGFDLSGFWEAFEVAAYQCTGPAFTAADVALVETRLGYRLPASYLALMRSRNGGQPVHTCHRTRSPTSWAADHIAVDYLFSIGDARDFSLCGSSGSAFWIEGWGYPPIGIYFASCPSGGHDMLCLDYRQCGPGGEPRVVHVDQESGFAITPVAPDFESFIRGLESEDAFEAP